MEHHLTEDGQEMELTIRWTKREDPMGLLSEWVWKGHLAAWLRTLTQPCTGGNPANEDDAYQLAIGMAWLARHTDEQLNLLLLILRDQHQAGLHRLSTALDVPRDDAKTRYEQEARDFARRGIYADDTGLRFGPTAEVQQAVEARLATRDAQEREAAEEVSLMEAGRRVRHRQNPERQGVAVSKTDANLWLIDWPEGAQPTLNEDIVPL